MRFDPLGALSRHRRLPLVALLLCAACVSYEPKPLHGAAIVEDVARQRASTNPAGEAEPVDLATATDWLREHGPTVRETVAAFRTAKARADVETPWPDPSLEFGPQAAWGPEVDSSRRVTPFVALAIPIPLGDRLNATDDLNRAQAERLRIEAVLTMRDEYLALRGDWSALATARMRERLLEEIAEAATRAARTARRLVEAGAATSLDVAIFELEQSRAESERLNATMSVAEAEGSLASRTGVAANHFRRLADDGLPTLPDAVPSSDTLREMLAAHRPDLVSLRARYAVAERALRLEVERQVPDLEIGPGFDVEAGEDKDVASLGIGLRLPIFDRNQQAIAEALEHREELRTRYETTANRALAEMEQLARRVELAGIRRRALEEDVLPRAEANEALARRAVEAGAADALRILEVQRSLRTLRVEAREARLTEIEAWVALERAVGHPLLTFPGEPTALPEPPAEAIETADERTREETLGPEHGSDEEGAR